MKLSTRFSIAVIIVGVYMIFISHTTPNGTSVDASASAWIGAVLTCTGLLSLTISEIFKKP